MEQSDQQRAFVGKTILFDASWLFDFKAIPAEKKYYRKSAGIQRKLRARIRGIKHGFRTSKSDKK